MALYETESDGVSSKDAKLVLTFPVAEIGVRVYGRFIISDSLMNKIKTHGKKLRDLFLQCEYAQRMSDVDKACDADEPTREYSEDSEQEDSADFAEFFEAEDEFDAEGNGEE